MTNPVLSGGETARLNALDHLQILDTLPEQAFDQLTSLAATVFSVPIVLISFIDRERQWVKSCYGLDTRQTHRSLSFCAHTVEAKELLVVPDATVDHRFADNALVTGAPHIRFYAGAPLIIHGHAVGTLCLIDTTPRSGLSGAHEKALVQMADLIAGQLLLRADAEQRLALKQHYRQIIEQSSDLIFTTDVAGHLTLINPAWEQHTGYPASEVLGENAIIVLHPEDRETAQQQLREFQDGIRTASRLECRYQRKDGQTGWTDIQLKALHDRRGHFEGVLGVANEITHHKKTQERLQLLESVVVNANDAVVITEAEPIDAPGPRILYVNEAFTRMSGYTLAEVQGQNPRMMQGPRSDPAVKARIRRALEARKPVLVELLNYRKDGAPFWLEMSIVPIANGKGGYTHFVSVQRDVTERRQAEERLQSQTRQQAVLADLAYSSITDDDLHVMLQHAAEQVALAMDVDIATVTEVQPHECGVSIRAGSGAAAGLVGHPYLDAVMGSLPRYAIMTGDPVIVPDLQTETRFPVDSWLVEQEVKCAVSVVINGLDGPYGALCVHSTRHQEFTADDIQFLRAVANVVGTTVEHPGAISKLRDSEKRYRTLVTNMPGAVYRCALDETWTMLYVNDGIENLSGYPAADFTGNARRTFASLILPEDRPQVTATVMNALEREEAFEFEYRIRHADGSERWLYERGRLAHAGILEGVMVDITTRKHAEQGLIEAREEAERANRAKSMFLSRVSHELRTPLNAILGFGQLIARNPAAPDKVGRHNQQVLTAGQHLLELVNDVLDVARIDSGEMAVAPTCLRMDQVIEECAALVMPQAAQAGLTITVTLGALSGTTVEVDAKRIRQVLFNLLGNAVKYTGSGGEVHVVGSVTPDHYARVAIHDTGPGMTQEQQDTLFQPFVRLEGEQSEKEGTGLGLSLCKRVVELMNGRIGVQSQVEVGSTFWFEFPLVSTPVGLKGPDEAQR